jgi:AcrR family transcriptional regulator
MTNRRRPHPDRPLPAVQDRSHATVDRLLGAAEELLRDGGADAATLRAIASRAGVSLGIVYRRFPDKDAILRAVYVRFFERAAALNRSSLEQSAVTGMPLSVLTKALVCGMARGYQEHRDLVRALILYARTHDDPDFRARAELLNAGTFARIAEIFASRSAEMNHPDPAIAVPFAIRMAAAALQDHALFGEPARRRGPAEQSFVDELTRAVSRYLGIRGS